MKCPKRKRRKDEGLEWDWTQSSTKTKRILLPILRFSAIGRNRLRVKLCLDTSAANGCVSQPWHQLGLGRSLCRRYITR